MADVVPALHGDPPVSFQHLFSVHGLEVLLLVAVGDSSKGHLPFDDSDRAISDSDFVAGIHFSSEADGCDVGQLPVETSASFTYSGVLAAGVLLKSALTPLAVLWVPVVLFWRAPFPVAVLVPVAEITCNG